MICLKKWILSKSDRCQLQAGSFKSQWVISQVFFYTNSSHRHSRCGRLHQLIFLPETIRSRRPMKNEEQVAGIRNELYCFQPLRFAVCLLLQHNLSLVWLRKEKSRGYSHSDPGRHSGILVLPLVARRVTYYKKVKRMHFWFLLYMVVTCIYHQVIK